MAFENVADINDIPKVLTVKTLMSGLKKLSGGETIMSKKEILRQINFGTLKAGLVGNKYVIEKCDFMDFWNNIFSNKKVHQDKNINQQSFAIDDEVKKALGIK